MILEISRIKLKLLKVIILPQFDVHAMNMISVHSMNDDFNKQYIGCICAPTTGDYKFDQVVLNKSQKSILSNFYE